MMPRGPRSSRRFAFPGGVPAGQRQDPMSHETRTDIRNLAIIAARGPRQDHAGGRHAVAERHLPRQRERHGAGHGLHRPGAREGHHHHGQEHLDRLPGGPHQHRGHPRSRRLRRRGGAHPQDGGRRPPAGGRQRGAASADALRPPQGAGVQAGPHRGDQQDRPLRRPHGRGAGRGLRPVHRPGRQRDAAGLSRLLLRRAQGAVSDDAGRSGPAACPPLRPDPRDHPGADLRPGGPAPAPDHLPGLRRLRGAPAHRPDLQRPRAQGAGCHPLPAGRQPGRVEGHPALRHPGPPPTWRSKRRARATSSPWPASRPPTSARPSRTRRRRSRCRPSRWTSPRSPCCSPSTTPPCPGARASTSPRRNCVPASTARRSPMSPSAWKRPSPPTPSRSPAAGSCSWPS